MESGKGVGPKRVVESGKGNRKKWIGELEIAPEKVERASQGGGVQMHKLKQHLHLNTHIHIHPKP